jgi:hypothetical protein
MDTIVVIALIAYVVLFGMALWVVQNYMSEMREISKKMPQKLKA